jgi:hypothetical protein
VSKDYVTVTSFSRVTIRQFPFHVMKNSPGLIGAIASEIGMNKEDFEALLD